MSVYLFKKRFGKMVQFIDYADKPEACDSR